MSAIDPAAAYLDSLGTPDSRRTMASALSQLAGALGVDASGSEVTSAELWRLYDWRELEAGRVERAIRALSADRGGASVAKLIAAVKGVASAGFRAGVVSAETLERVRLIRGLREVRDLRGREVERSERDRLEAACDAGPLGDRDRALLALLFGAGLRRSEAARVELSGWAARSLRFVGKGRKIRTVAVTTEDAKRIDAWVSVRGREPGPLLYAFSPQRVMLPRGITGDRIYKILLALAQSAGVERCTPHDGRRTLATALFRANARPATIQGQLGHANIATSIRYDRTALEEQLNEVERLLSGK